MRKVTILLFTVISMMVVINTSCQKSGSKYVGKWDYSYYTLAGELMGVDTITIEKIGDNYMVSAVYHTVAFNGTYIMSKEGSLIKQVGYGEAVLVYNDKTKSIVGDLPFQGRVSLKKIK